MLSLFCVDILYFDGFVFGRGNKMIFIWYKRNIGYIVIMICSIYVYV